MPLDLRERTISEQPSRTFLNVSSRLAGATRTETSAPQLQDRLIIKMTIEGREDPSLIRDPRRVR
jgi:hypothetical protein